ncbi:adenylate kinase 5, chloroplastic-like [Eucalyptus grandis]|uniref:adenylate kinase 5, chloroplastic-like n=1 Tax=Eucalyptus grandis TaxID=71139 RepID=UPI00192ECE88|nr:adenylate kinase 5, chloroplastic-like [Eucalyptus grandis]
MGEGALAGMPLQLAGSCKILEFMDWGDHGALGTFVKIGSIGAKEVDEQDDIFILVAPQNAVGNCIIDDLRGVTESAGMRPVILINPRLKTMGRNKRLEYAASFENCYFFRLLYYAGTQYPIMDALRMSHPYPSNCTHESISHLGRSISCFQHSMEDQVVMKSTMPSLGNREIKSRTHPEYAVS